MSKSVTISLDVNNYLAISGHAFKKISPYRSKKNSL